MGDIQKDIEHAAQVAAEARVLREDLRWTVVPGDTDREAQIDEMLEEIRKAMVPIRSALGRARYDAYTPAIEERLAAVSQDLQYQRKQLKKMRRS